MLQHLKVINEFLKIFLNSFYSSMDLPLKVHLW